MVVEEGGCRRCCCRFVFTSGLTALFIWLSLRAANPACSIENFEVFALNKTANSSYQNHNHTIRYDLKLNNKQNKDKGVYYDPLNLTFYYQPNTSNNSFVTLGYATVGPFYQGHGKNTHRINTIDATGVRWENDTATRAVFRVELNTTVRFKILFWKTKRHRLALRANLQVNEQGSLVKRRKKGIKFTSGVGNSKVCNFALLGILGILMHTLIIG